MTLGERIRRCRQNAGLSQEDVADRLGVSRQAVTKWENGRSAPNTENLFALAELFGTSVDLLLEGEAQQKTLVQECYELFRREEQRKIARRRERGRQNAAAAGVTALGYLALYLLGRLLWCDLAQTSVMGWLLWARPEGRGSYLYGWLLHNKLFWWAMAVGVLPALFGKHRFAASSLGFFAAALAAGTWFGANPAGAAYGQGDFGWAIWGGIVLFSIGMGCVLERLNVDRPTLRSPAVRRWVIAGMVGIGIIILLVRAAIPSTYGN